MTRIAFLADDRAESIRGGFWGSSTSIRMFKSSSVATNLGQSNQVTNLGLGVLAGAGNAQSIQGNGASIFTLVG